MSQSHATGRSTTSGSASASPIPDIDIGMVARGQGAKGFGPCRNAGELEKALKEAIAVVEGGGVAVVDARILGGYSPATAAAMARGKADRGT